MKNFRLKHTPGGVLPTLSISIAYFDIGAVNFQVRAGYVLSSKLLTPRVKFVITNKNTKKNYKHYNNISLDFY